MTNADDNPTMFTSGQIAAMLGARLEGPDDLPVSSIGPLDTGGPRDLSYIRDRRFADAWPGSKVNVALVSEHLDIPGHDPRTRALIRVPDAELALIRILERVAPAAVGPPPGVHPTAIVDASATLAEDVAVGPYAVVGPATTVASGTVVAARVSIGAHVVIGASCSIRPGVVIEDRCRIGDRCIIHANATIGADGFGYKLDESTGLHVKIPHAGTVVIGDDVEIGASACIDRAKFGATSVGDGAKIDNLVQIAHNCAIGRGALICGQVGLAGSVTIGEYAVLAGQVGVADHLAVGARSIVTAQSGVTIDIPPEEVWTGTPAMERREYAAMFVSLRKLGRKRRPTRSPFDARAT